MKQTKLRRRRVVRYAILYFVLFVIFLALIVGPAVAGNKIDLSSLFDDLESNLKMGLVQPTGLSNDDTQGRKPTGTGSPSYSGVWTPTTGRFATATATHGSNRLL